MNRFPILTPLLFAVYYLLFLYSVNVGEASPGDIPLPLVLMLLLAVVTWGVMRLVLRDGSKAAVLAVVALFLFVSYGHIYLSLQGFHLFGMRFDRHRHWLPIWTALFAVAGLLVWRARSDLRGAVRFINRIILILTALALFNVVRGHLATAARMRRLEQPSVVSAPSKAPLGYLPDIYYFILDGYANNQTLRSIYDFDNTRFLDSLRERGFYVADSACSNYAHTPSSLSSTLNMKYVNFITDLVGEDAVYHTVAYKLVREGEVIRRLKAMGYRYILLRSGFAATDRSPLADLSIKCGRYNEFIKVLAHTTMLIVVEKHLVFLDWHRDNIRAELDYLEREAPRLPGPKFLFAHILIPHSPYLFDAEGNPVSAQYTLLGQNIWLPRSGYVAQMTYLNGRVERIVDSILAASPRPPVILIQGDHGPASLDEWADPGDEFLAERMTILSAYHLPVGADSLLYPGITPVNSFRVVLDGCFGADLPLLDDRVFFSNMYTPYKFVNVTDRVRRAQRGLTPPARTAAGPDPTPSP